MKSFGAALLLGNRRYTLYLLSRFSLLTATQMLSVVVGWQVYEIKGAPLALGLSGLALFLPALGFTLVGGHVADVHDRRRVLLACHLGVATCSSALAALSWMHVRTVTPIYGVLMILGTIRAFSGPAGQALMPSLVPREQLERAVAVSSSTFQLGMVAGPAIGGALYALTGRAWAVYGVCACMALIAAVAVFFLAKVPAHPTLASAPQAAAPRRAATWSTVLAGIRYVSSEKTVLGAISLDLFAVLLGGSVALLPIFARDTLHVGTFGLGILRSAPGLGAAMMALVLARFPLRRRAGATMLACVAIFGLATIAFGLSRDFFLSLGSLAVLGAADMVSVVVRSTLIQTRTPDPMRGRVGAVNLVFIGASNELGEFESGVTAQWFGPVVAVVAGGVGTCLIVSIWSFLFPDLRRVDRA